METDLNLARLILPVGITAYFTISKVEEKEKEVNIYLTENNDKPEEYSSEKLTSKGFFDEIKVQDFPLRGRNVYLFIKRRRWVVDSTGDIVYRNWEHIAKGTRMTKEFAAFLKAIARY